MKLRLRMGAQHGGSLQRALSKLPEENCIPGPLKAVQVSLVKPLAYLKYQINYHPQSGWFEDTPLKGGTEEGYPLKGGMRVRSS